MAGLGLIGLTAPAMAAPEKVTVCHNNGSSWEALEFNVNGLSGHDQHPLDIIPPTSQSAGKNWTDAGKLLYVDNCAPLPPGETLPVVVEPPVVTPPVVTPPVDPPVVVEPVVEQPVVVPPAEQPVVHPPVAAEVVAPPAAPPAASAPVVPAQPAAATPQVPARTGAAASATTNLGTNKGYNAQTAVGGAEYSPAWVAGLGALVAAGAAVAVRRRADASAAG
ncbi:hypothetical protein G205_06138 [Arthrobacter nitrophenolicus]|uniref:Uncharacterized protein n=1 Tax=Arthrobacter nitrophenolicus TaxID=683150 RepID=L8TTY6_9MICC|nr:hypothetical protein G205_06138 [Arthrobacter nitrophenolicus]